jgi:hypothetical protein
VLNLSGTYQAKWPITILVPDRQQVNIIEIVPIRSAHLARAFFLAAAVTVPWTIFVAIALPRHYTAHHYWLGWFGWFGFDVALIVELRWPTSAGGSPGWNRKQRERRQHLRFAPRPRLEVSHTKEPIR